MAKATHYSDDMQQDIINSMSTLLSANRLDQILEALSKGCMAHCRDMLNADMPIDNQGNTLRMLFDFSERISRLARSAATHNEKAPKLGREWTEKDRVKAKTYSKKYDDDEIE